jgi:hypothetical protein
MCFSGIVSVVFFIAEWMMQYMFYFNEYLGECAAAFGQYLFESYNL